MTEEVRVRFAPSPTGFLHIGGVRTALFNWLFARHNHGTFILRIEDTDRERSTEDSIQEIIESLRWLGLDWDEGPFRQMERKKLYLEKAKQLLDAGKAYLCYCSPEDLEAKRKAAQARKEKPRYDGTCRNRTEFPKGAPHVIRFKCPQEGNVVVNDLLRGNVEFNVAELDDFIIFRTDGTPTYNFVVVVDDADMRITHVIRGDDHLSNTPRQALMYDALGFPRPQFAHLSMILGPDKTRLSKRHGATATLAYRDMGYLPDALVNYLARLGWSHGDQEIFTRQEMIEHFSLEHVTISAAVFNPEKLEWVNEQWIQKSIPAELAGPFEAALIKEGILPEEHDKTLADLIQVIPSLQQRAKTLIEMAHGAEFYFKDVVVEVPTAELKLKGFASYIKINEKAMKKFLTPEVKPLFDQLVAGLEAMDEPLDHDAIETLFKQTVEEAGLKLGKLAQPVRVALTGKTASPGIFDVVLLLGKQKTVERLRSAVHIISTLKE
ncbi:MAG: glutamate--tRNA ligase [Nitrospinae bacterium]|nr:glutamate--tRNA ligase [Nitrospinota bacterium]